MRNVKIKQGLIIVEGLSMRIDMNKNEEDNVKE